MGTWGHGPLQNDEASELLDALVDESTVEEILDVVIESMREALDSGGFVEIPVMNKALAAAAVVAVSVRGDVIDDGDERDQIEGFALDPDDAAIRLAAATIDRAFDASDNEWFDVRDEAGTLEVARAELAPFRDTLTV